MNIAILPSQGIHLNLALLITHDLRNQKDCFCWTLSINPNNPDETLSKALNFACSENDWVIFFSRDNLELLEGARFRNSNVNLCMISGEKSIQGAVSAHGAHFILKGECGWLQHIRSLIFPDTPTE